MLGLRLVFKVIMVRVRIRVAVGFWVSCWVMVRVHVLKTVVPQLVEF